MKKTTRTLTAALVLGSLGLGSVIGHAADYEDATNVTTEGRVTILENDTNDPVVPDPENPEEEVTPEEPTNPHPGLLRINYVSNFDFGQIKNVSRAIEQEARQDYVWSGGQETGRVPFVATEDRRGTDRLGWELQVSQPKQLTDASGHELQGATITLSGLRYANASDSAPVVNPNELVLGEAAQTLATADATQGAGAWTLALGNADGEGQTDGVVLRVPANTTKNDTVYSTAIVWELVADPTTGTGE
ncbi:WxL domain-containing protein [Enterococcus sp. OL5]|uniref:WxL domain-containing protein n=1 Tax=Enterococcus sp. OL5 TaxID=2590214 RepID=UPI00112AA77A|nr:WxL domain-containing protein [Enterococcus sp. OL5]TPR55076.1 WxL domain-containing protein [Enterococcus sp. OL5]